MVMDGFPSVRQDITNVQTPGCITFANVPLPLAKPVTRSSPDPVGGDIVAFLKRKSARVILQWGELAFDYMGSSLIPWFYG